MDILYFIFVYGVSIHRCIYFKKAMDFTQNDGMYYSSKPSYHIVMFDNKTVESPVVSMWYFVVAYFHNLGHMRQVSNPDGNFSQVYAAS